MDAYEEGTYDNPDKSCGWHTALYYYAEHVRALSRSAINHKMLYAHIGTKGYYINHENPLIRKRTAAALSRLIHSSRYAEDLRASYRDDNGVFDAAAAWLLESLRANSGCEDTELADRFAGSLLLDVERGLINERAGGREDLNPVRVVNEVQALASWGGCGAADPERFTVMASSMLHLMAFGHLDERFVASLVDETPLRIQASPRKPASSIVQNACLIKYVGDACVVADAWFLDGEHAFSIGRYSDCDVIETNQYASRLHCVIWRSGGRWFVKDEGSLHGTVVLDAQDNIVFDSCSGSGRVCELKYGQRIVLAQSSTYWFCAMNDRPSGMFAT